MNPADVKKLINGAMRGVRQALRGMLASASGKKRVILVQMQGTAGETYNGAEYFQHAGFRSVPLNGMQPVIVPLNGSSANGVVVAMSNGVLFIADMQPGEVAIYNENDGVANSVILRNGKIIDIQCDTLNITATTAINFTAPAMSINASDRVAIDTPNIDASGRITAVGEVKSQGVSLPGHKHPKISRGLALSDPPQ